MSCHAAAVASCDFNDRVLDSSEDTSPRELAFYTRASGLEGLSSEVMPLVEGIADRCAGTALFFDA